MYQANILDFDSLPYRNKVFFVHKPMPDVKSACYIECVELNGDDSYLVKSLTSYRGKMIGMIYIDLFDYIEFCDTGNIL